MEADGSVLRRQLGWGDSPVIAFVGQQVPHKGVDMLTGVMPAVWERHPDACLLIAGARSTYSSTIEGWVAGLPEARRSRVALIHDFSEDEKPGIFAACDMLASPSGFESFGRCLFGSMGRREACHRGASWRHTLRRRRG